MMCEYYVSVCFQFSVFNDEPLLHQQTLADDLRTSGSCGATYKNNKEESQLNFVY